MNVASTSVYITALVVTRFTAASVGESGNKLIATTILTLHIGQPLLGQLVTGYIVILAMTLAPQPLVQLLRLALTNIKLAVVAESLKTLNR